MAQEANAFDTVMDLLERIDGGYEPTEEERQTLFNMEALTYRSDRSVRNLPKSMVLLVNLRKLDLSTTSIDEISVLTSLKNLEELDLSYTNVNNIEALSKLRKLKVLNLEDTEVTDGHPLAELTELVELNLSGTKLQAAECLDGLTRLRILYLSNTDVQDTGFLRRMTQLEQLSLDGTGITSCEDIAELNEVVILDISRTTITDIYPLRELKNLRELGLRESHVSDMSILAELEGLEELDLSYTERTYFDFLKPLSGLRILSLRGTEIENLQALAGLEHLESLDISHTKLKSLESLPEFLALKKLSMAGEEIKDIRPLKRLKGLTYLYLFGLPVEDVSALSVLTGLRYLNLNYTRVKDIDALNTLVHLQVLDLSGTPLSRLPLWLSELHELRRLSLCDMRLHEIPAEFMQLNLPFFVERPRLYNRDGVHMYDTKIAIQPLSLFEQPKELIEAYYASEQVPINEAKVIFLGDGGAGKTHTIRRIINGGKKGEYRTETTPGIDITNYTANYDGQQFGIHFWDFGGQEIMHAMHRCFLTERTCYVVVVSNRWNLNSQARYWLKNIDSFAKDAPVLIAVNRWDSIQEDGLDMSRLTQDYPNLVREPVYYSAKYSEDGDFCRLIDTIVRQASKLDSSAMSFPAQWAAVRRELLEVAESKHYIDKMEYHSICDRNGLESVQIRTWLLEWFNDLGVCFSYHQDMQEKSELASYKVLNPSWLTNAIYIIINAGRRYSIKGTMRRELVQQLLSCAEYGVLPQVTYTDRECDYVLDVMRKFRLSYQVSQDIEFIPALCDSETPNELHPQSYEQRLTYRCEYPYLPDSVVHQLMIRFYRDLNPDKIWRKGLRIDISFLGLTAIVDMGRDDSTLQIDVYSSGDVEPWKLLNNIRMALEEINRGLGLNARDYIIIHAEGGEIPITVDELLDAKEQGIDPLHIHNPFTRRYERHGLDELLGKTFGRETMSAAARMSQMEEYSLPQALGIVNREAYYSGETINIALRVIETMSKAHYETNAKLVDALIAALEASGNEQIKAIVQDVKSNSENKKNLLTRIEELLKTPASIAKNTATLYSAGKSIIKAIKTIEPMLEQNGVVVEQIMEGMPLL